MKLAGLLVVAVVAGCAEPDAVMCNDRVCPASTTCDEVHGLCVVDEQLRVCAGQPDGTPCEAAGRSGLCDAGTCIAGCGDGVADAGEECDDGNRTDNDGCSTLCIVETPRWSRWQPAWQGLARHVAVFDVARGRLVAVTGKDELHQYEEQWERGSLGQWTHAVAGLPPRHLASATYDPVRNRIVVFGGLTTTETNETWEFDGSIWTQRMIPSPPARYAAGMTFDTARGKVVLFGGRDVDSYLNDTWEYDGTAWTALTTTGALTARSHMSLAYDPMRNVVVLFGGQNNGGTRFDTWELIGTTWSEVATPVRPQARYQGSLQYFPKIQKLVLFGGFVACGDPTTPQRCTAADTWEYGATGWTNRILASSPAARAEASLTYDPLVDRLVLVGGIADLGDVLADVWEYDGVVWIRASPRVQPSERQGSAMAASPTGEVMLFGGFDRELQHLDDTWRFAGGEWSEQLPATVPSERTDASLELDSRRGRFVLFGGRRINTYRQDAYEWTNGDWVALPMPTPSARSESVFVDDVAGSRLVLFGGETTGQTKLGDTWELTASGWQATSATQPGMHVNAAAAYDENRQRVVMVDPQGTTWTYEGGAWAELPVTRAAPPRSAASMAYVSWRGTVVRFGGSDTALRGDLWELVHDPVTGTDAWQEVELLGQQPPLGTRPGFVPLANEHALLLFGGADVGETWILQWR